MAIANASPSFMQTSTRYTLSTFDDIGNAHKFSVREKKNNERHSLVHSSVRQLDID